MAKTPLKNNVYCFIDFETTGVPAEDHWPIQIGMVFTGPDLQVITEFEMFVPWLEVYQRIKRQWIGSGQWPEEWADAERFHHITVQEYLDGCHACANMDNRGQIPPHKVVVERIAKHIECVANHLSRKQEDLRYILISDNIQFEWQLLRAIYDGGRRYDADSELVGWPEDHWPFHYCGWDTSVLLEWLGDGDPENPEHRALSDARGLHKAVVNSLEFLGNQLGICFFEHFILSSQGNP